MLDYESHSQLCPCCSRKLFAICCKPFIDGGKYPETAEQLMRSRFTAYTFNKSQYIFDTYTKAEQSKQSITDISEWANENQWIKLVIHQANNNITPATVDFSAFYLHKNQLIEMRENSSFIKEPKWRYQHGELKKHEVIKSIKRNDACPCESNKKYKKCCGG